MTELSREEVLQILDLIEKSDFDFFELDTGDLKLTVSKTGLVRSSQDGVSIRPQADAPSALPQATTITPAPAAAPVAVSEATVQQQAASQPHQQADAGDNGAPGAAAQDLIAVKAPMIGTFYAQAEPGAPPYVQVGSHVDEDATLGLIEVMKVFNAIRAGVRGVVAEILVQNAQFVEFGQILFLIKPDTAADGNQP